MYSYISLIVELESAKRRLRKSVPLVPARNSNRARAGRTGPLIGLGTKSLESIVWIVSCLLVILGAIKAGQSEQPLFWLAVWPFPVAFACTIFIFVR